MISKKCLRFIITSLETGGAELHLLRITPSLIANGFTVRILVTNAEKKESLTQDFQQAGASVQFLTPAKSVHKISNRAPIKLAQAAQALYQDMRAHPSDITHCFLPKAYLMGMVCAKLARYRAPILMSRRSLNHYQQKYPLIRWLEKHFHQRANHILANSQAVLKQLREEGVRSDRLGLIYNGIDKPPAQNPAKLKAQYQLQDCPLILMKVANLSPHKGHADLLTALGKIKSQLTGGWRLVCIGFDRKHYGQTLKKQAETLGITKNIIWLTNIPDASHLYTMADMVILSSHGEGFSNVILEAMASGKPVIATDVGGNKEAIVDQETGLIVPVHQPEALAEAIVSLSQARNTREAMGRKAQKRWQEHFTLANCTAQYLKLYQEIIEGSTCVA